MAAKTAPKKDPSYTKEVNESAHRFIEAIFMARHMAPELLTDDEISKIIYDGYRIAVALDNYINES